MTDTTLQNFVAKECDKCFHEWENQFTKSEKAVATAATITATKFTGLLSVKQWPSVDVCDDGFVTLMWTSAPGGIMLLFDDGDLVSVLTSSVPTANDRIKYLKKVAEFPINDETAKMISSMVEKLYGAT